MVLDSVSNRSSSGSVESPTDDRCCCCRGGVAYLNSNVIQQRSVQWWLPLPPLVALMEYVFTRILVLKIGLNADYNVGVRAVSWPGACVWLGYTADWVLVLLILVVYIHLSSSYVSIVRGLHDGLCMCGKCVRVRIK